MKICTFASGSSGNCTLIWHNSTYILIDAGISMRKIVNAMNALSFEVRNISAILLTHEHSDHISGIPMLVKHFGLRVMASGGTARALIRNGKLSESHISVFDTATPFTLGELEVNSFETPHDTAESVGFTLNSGNQRLAYATDLGHVTSLVEHSLKSADTVVLESNHDVNMLKCGTYPYHTKMRILGSHGHLSNEAGSELATKLACWGTRNIVLAHLSRDNNTPEIARAVSEDALRNAGVQPNVDVRLFVAPADSLSDIVEA